MCPKEDPTITENPLNEEPQSTPKMNSGILKAISVLLALSLYVTMGLNDNFWTPFLTNELSKLGVPRLFIGVILASSTISGFFCAALFMLVHHDKRKTRELLFVSGSFTVGVACFVFGQLPKVTSGYYLIGLSILTRLVIGFGSNLLWCSGVPLLISLFPNWTGRLCSWVSLAMAFGFILGAPLGSALFKVGGYDFPFTVVGSLQIFLPMFCYLVFARLSKPADQSNKSPVMISRQDSPKLLTPGLFLLDPDVLCLCLAAISTAAPVGFLAVSFSHHLKDFHEINSVQAGSYFLPFTISRAIAAFMSGYFTDKGYGGISFCIFGCCANVVGFFCFGVLPYIPWENKLLCSEVLLGLIGISSTTAFVPLIPLIRKLMTRKGFTNLEVVDRYAAIMYTLCFGFGNILGTSLLGGFAVDKIGFYNSCIVEASICAATGLLGSVCLAKNELLFKFRRSDELVLESVSSSSSSSSSFEHNDSI